MKRTCIDSIVTEKALRIVNGFDNGKLLDLMAEDPDYQLPLKNVCAKLSVPLSDEIDRICGLLDVSKREFIQAALVDAIRKANEILEEEGANQALIHSLEPAELVSVSTVKEGGQ